MKQITEMNSLWFAYTVMRRIKSANVINPYELILHDVPFNFLNIFIWKYKSGNVCIKMLVIGQSQIEFQIESRGLYGLKFHIKK